MEQGLKWHTRMVKAREKLRATPPEEKQDLEMVSIFSFGGNYSKCSSALRLLAIVNLSFH